MAHTSREEDKDAQVVEHVARAIEQGKVPRGAAQDLLNEKIPDAKSMGPAPLRAAVEAVLGEAFRQDLRGTLQLLGQTARAGGAKGLG